MKNPRVCGHNQVATLRREVLPGRELMVVVIRVVRVMESDVRKLPGELQSAVDLVNGVDGGS